MHNVERELIIILLTGSFTQEKTVHLEKQGKQCLLGRLKLFYWVLISRNRAGPIPRGSHLRSYT